MALELQAHLFLKILKLVVSLESFTYTYTFTPIIWNSRKRTMGTCMYCEQISRITYGRNNGGANKSQSYRVCMLNTESGIHQSFVDCMSARYQSLADPNNCTFVIYSQIPSVSCRYPFYSRSQFAFLRDWGERDEVNPIQFKAIRAFNSSATRHTIT